MEKPPLSKMTILVLVVTHQCNAIVSSKYISSRTVLRLIEFLQMLLLRTEHKQGYRNDKTCFDYN